jgi:hypothetical protein
VYFDAEEGNWDNGQWEMSIGVKLSDLIPVQELMAQPPEWNGEEPKPVVPDGYVLVPVEPTEAMLMAWFSATRESSEGVGTLGYFRAAYKALLSAGKEDV